MKKLAILAAALLLSSCGGYEAAAPTRAQEQETTEQNQQRLLQETPLPTLEMSLERQNLAERLGRINQQTMTGCIYLVSYGRVMAFYPVRGKVTSLNAYLTGQEQLVNDPHGDLSAGSVLMESPDLDGAYGENADGVFFFTSDTNAYVEWRGEYLWSDQCLRLSQEPMMVRQVP